MSVMELDAFRAELARTILTTEDYDLLDKIKQLIGLQGKKEDTAKEECGKHPHARIAQNCKGMRAIAPPPPAPASRPARPARHRSS